MIEEFLAMLTYWFRHCQRNNGEEENEELEEEDPEN